MKKRGKNPTRLQKEYISGNGLDAYSWLVKSEDQEHLYLINRESGRERKVKKGKRECRRYGKT